MLNLFIKLFGIYKLLNEIWEFDVVLTNKSIVLKFEETKSEDLSASLNFDVFLDFEHITLSKKFKTEKDLVFDLASLFIMFAYPFRYPGFGSEVLKQSNQNLIKEQLGEYAMNNSLYEILIGSLELEDSMRFSFSNIFDCLGLLDNFNGLDHLNAHIAFIKRQ